MHRGSHWVTLGTAMQIKAIVKALHEWEQARKDLETRMETAEAAARFWERRYKALRGSMAYPGGDGESSTHHGQHEAAP